MNAPMIPQPAALPVMPRKAIRSPWIDPSWRDVEAALERMSVRINAATAHRNSLQRAAQGVRTVSIQLGLLLNCQTAWGDRPEAAHLVCAAIEVMQQETDAVTAAAEEVPVEVLRSRLRWALANGRTALILLG